MIGVSVATYRGGQNLNFAIPVSYLTELLGKTASPPKSLADMKRAESERSVLADFGEKSSEGVIATQLTWDTKYAQDGSYTFSFRNMLRDDVNSIYCVVIFYDSDGNPLDIDVVRHSSTIPAGLAKRVDGNVDGSVQELTTSSGSKTPQTKVEFRILDFKIVE